MNFIVISTDGCIYICIKQFDAWLDIVLYNYNILMFVLCKNGYNNNLSYIVKYVKNNKFGIRMKIQYLNHKLPF